MRARQKSAILLLPLIASMTALVSFHLRAGDRPVPARTAQMTGPSSEPPPYGPAQPAPGMESPCTEDPPTPSVSLRVRVPATTSANQELEYRIIVENCSEAAAHHVTVRNPLPANARFVRSTPPPTNKEPDLSWELGTLQPCNNREIILVLSPTGAGDVSNCARVQFEHGQCVTTRLARPALRVRKIGPPQAALNEAITFRVTVTNTGSVEAVNVHLIDVLPEGLEHESMKKTLSWQLGNLAPGQSRQVDYQVTARKAGRWCNRVAASTSDGAKDEAENCVEVGRSAGLEMLMRGPEQAFAGRPATYQITVSNTGGLPANNVVITNPLPAGTTFVSGSQGFRFDGAQVQWVMGQIPAGGRQTVQVALQAAQAGEIVNKATARADRSPPVNGETKTLFETAAGLTFHIESKDPILEVGSKTTYVVTVLNQGNAPVTKLQLTATLPEQFEYVDSKGPTNGKADGAKVIFEPFAMLAPRAEVRFEINVKAVRNGEAKFQADLSAEQLGERPVHREQTATIYK